MIFFFHFRSQKLKFVMFRSIPQNLNLVEFKKLCVWLIGEHLTFTQCLSRNYRFKTEFRTLTIKR